MAEFIPDVSDREVIIGGGVHAAIYCATRVALGFERPLVLERESVTGGVFARYIPFWLNSANRASLQSVRPGPTRTLPESPSDELNWLPNCETQVSDVSRTEYPSSADVALAVQRNLRRYAEVITGVNAELSYPEAEAAFTAEGRRLLPRRLIDARGLQMGDEYQRPPVMSASAFLSGKATAGISPAKVAVVGGGDTGSIVVEQLLGMSVTGAPFDARSITWFGQDLPASKDEWAGECHARYISLARHFPQAGRQGMIRPVNSRAEVVSIGKNACLANGEVFDLAIMCTGFTSAAVMQLSGDPRDGLAFEGCRRIGNDFYAVGAVMTPAGFSSQERDLGFDRFGQNMAAIFRLGRRTARLAARLPR